MRRGGTAWEAEAAADAAEDPAVDVVGGGEGAPTEGEEDERQVERWRHGVDGLAVECNPLVLEEMEDLLRLRLDLPTQGMRNQSIKGGTSVGTACNEP